MNLAIVTSTKSTWHLSLSSVQQLVSRSTYTHPLGTSTSVAPGPPRLRGPNAAGLLKSPRSKQTRPDKKLPHSVVFSRSAEPVECVSITAHTRDFHPSMDRQQQQQKSRFFLPPPPLHLPMCWTPTDQVIMEDLLLSHDAVSPRGATATTTSFSSSTSSSSSSSSSSYYHSSDLKTERPTLPHWSDHRSHSTSSTSSAESSPLSRTTATSAPASLPQRTLPRTADEERRARHRAVQKRFVQRKKETIRQTKLLAAGLERQYALLQVTSEQTALVKENAVLAAQCAAVSSVPDPLSLLHEHMELVREFYEPLTADDFAVMLRTNLHEFELASADTSFRSSGLTIMGWHDQRKMDDTTVTFVLSKEFPHVDAHALLEKTWAQLSAPETHAQFFSPLFTVRVQVLQVVDENTRVIHRALYNSQTGRIAHGLDVLCRVRRGADYVIFESAVAHNAVHACLGASHQWSQISVSHVFSPAGSDSHGCIYRHGGILRDFVVSTVKYWLMEMFFMALRYESAMVAPIFTLTPE